MAEAAEPLLEAYWADAASVPHTAPTTRICCPTITEIQERYPNQVRAYSVKPVEPFRKKVFADKT